MNTPEQQLSDSLLAACKSAGIEKPRYIAQDKDEPYVWHYDLKPDTDDTKELDMWAVDNGNATKIHHPPYADDWKESLLEWVDHIADTSKMIDMQDAIADAYRKHVGRLGLQTYAQTYRHGWQDALAWKGGSDD